MMPASADMAVRVRGVSKHFVRQGWRIGRAREVVQALREVDLDIPAGSRFGVVGESGSGKTTLMRLIAALDAPSSGRIEVAGLNVVGRRERDVRPLRRILQMVFQDPASSLDPRMRVGDIVAEPLHARRLLDVDATVAQALESVGLDASAAHRFPHEFSGGERQRISLARAIAPRPRILIADEPVSALDVTLRAQLLDLLLQISVRDHLTLVFVSHDLAVVREICDHVAVLHRGRIAEQGPTARVFRAPEAGYTRDLLAAVPTLERSLAAARDRLRRGREPRDIDT